MPSPRGRKTNQDALLHHLYNELFAGCALLLINYETPFAI